MNIKRPGNFNIFVIFLHSTSMLLRAWDGSIRNGLKMKLRVTHPYHPQLFIVTLYILHFSNHIYATFQFLKKTLHLIDMFEKRRQSFKKC